FDFDPESRVIGNDEAEIADLRQIGAREVDLVDDAEAQREPQPRRPQRTAHDILRAAAPSGPKTGGTGRGPLLVGRNLSSHRSKAICDSASSNVCLRASSSR